jgi:hypothetical protein
VTATVLLLGGPAHGQVHAWDDVPGTTIAITVPHPEGGLEQIRYGLERVQQVIPLHLDHRRRLWVRRRVSHPVWVHDPASVDVQDAIRLVDEAGLWATDEEVREPLPLPDPSEEGWA